MNFVRKKVIQEISLSKKYHMEIEMFPFSTIIKIRGAQGILKLN
jgi:hypothetical protein